VGLSFEIVKVLQQHHSCSKKSARGVRGARRISRGGRSFPKIECKKEAHSTRVPRRRLLLQALVVMPWTQKARFVAGMMRGHNLVQPDP